MATYWVDPYINAPINGTAGAAGTTARGTSGSYSTPWDWIDIFGQYFPGTTDNWGTHLAPGDEIRFKGFSSSDFYPAGNAKSWNPTTFSSYTNSSSNVTYRYYYDNSTITQYRPFKTANKDGTVRHFNPHYTNYLKSGTSSTWHAGSFQLDPNGYTEFDTDYMINASTYNSGRSGNQASSSNHYLFGTTNWTLGTNGYWANPGINNGHSSQFITITAGWDSETTQNGQTHIVFDQSFSFSGHDFYFTSHGAYTSDKTVWSAPEFYFYSPHNNADCHLYGLSVHIGGWISQEYVTSRRNEIWSGPYQQDWDSYGTTPTLPGTQQIGDIKLNEWIFGSYIKIYMNPNNNTATLDIPEINHGYQYVDVYAERRHYHNGTYPSNQNLKASDLNCKWHIKLKRLMSAYELRVSRNTWYYNTNEAVVDFTFDNDWFIRKGIKFEGQDWILGTETIGTQASTSETTAGIIELYQSGANILSFLPEPSYQGIGSTEVAGSKIYSNGTSVFKQLALLDNKIPKYSTTNYFYSEWIIENGENINNVSVSPMTWSNTAWFYNTVSNEQNKTTNGTFTRIYRNSASAYVMNEPQSGRSVTMMAPVDADGPSAAYYKSSDFNNNYTFKLWGSSNGRYYCKGFEIPLWDYTTGSDKTLSTTFTTSTSPGIDVWIQIIGFSPTAGLDTGIKSYYLYEIPATVSGTNLTFSQVISNELLKANLITRLEGKILLNKTSSSTGHVATSDITVI